MLEGMLLAQNVLALSGLASGDSQALFQVSGFVCADVTLSAETPTV